MKSHLVLVLCVLAANSALAGTFGTAPANTTSTSGVTVLSSNTAPHNGKVITITADFGSTVAGTVKFKQFRDPFSNGKLIFISESSALTVVAGQNTYVVSFTASTGDYFGYYLSSGTPKNRTATGGSGTSYWYTGDDVDTQGHIYNTDSNPISMQAVVRTEVTADITADTTWNYAGSPYNLNPSGGSGGTIKVRNGKKLTIDSSSGIVSLHWNEDCDFQIGNGSGDAGDLVIKAAGGAVNFLIKTGGNVVINPYGSINFSSTTYATTFTRFDGSNTGGALIFDAGQTKQSGLKNCSFSYLGYDSKDGALYVKSSATFVPTLENLSFDNCNTAALRMDGNGINVLKSGNLLLPLSVSNTTYVLYLSAVTSTVASVVFPDPTTPDSSTFKLTGTNQVGDASNISHWRFLDGCTFKCAGSSKVQVVNGSVWGSAEARPLFESDAGSPTRFDWVGLVDDSTTKANVFGDAGPFGFLDIRNATYGVDFNKGSLVPDSTRQTLCVLKSISPKYCGDGIRVKTTYQTSGVLAGFTVRLEACSMGGLVSNDSFNSSAVRIESGRVEVQDCTVQSLAFGLTVIGDANTDPNDVTVRGSRFVGGGSAPYGVSCTTCQGAGSLVIERTIIESFDDGVRLFQGSSYAPTRKLTIRQCCISGVSGQSVTLECQSASVCTVLVEDCTLVSPSFRGLYGLEMRSTSSMLARRVIFSDVPYRAVDLISRTNNTCEYTFEECVFEGNIDAIYDGRTQTARAVANRCTFRANSGYATYDASGGAAATNLQAKNCFWNSTTGPDVDPDDADPSERASSNVDYTPFLKRPYVGWLIGGSPAGVSALGINNAIGATTYADQLHIIDDDSFAVKWTFASDLSASAQSAYEIEIDNNADFLSLTYNGSKTTSGSSDIAITPALTAGTNYYLRVRLWDASDRHGPWYYHAFRTNSVPPTASLVSPADAAALADSTPVFVWDCAADAESDPLGFTLLIEYYYTPRSNWYTLLSYSSASTYPYGAGFEYSTDSGATWNPWPRDGLPSGATRRVRFTPPASVKAAYDGAGGSSARWSVAATDGFETGSAPSTRTFSFALAYTFAGKLTSDGTTGIGNVTVKLYVNGTYNTSTTTDNTTPPNLGTFTLSTSTDLLAGDNLIILRDGGGGTTRAARLVQYSGNNMTGLDLRYKRVYVQQTQSEPIVNDDFAFSPSNSDIPWTVSSHNVTFASDISTQPGSDGVYLTGQWDLTGTVNCTSNDVDFRITTTGTLHTLGFNVDCHFLDNDGLLEVTGGSRLIIDGANSTSSGTTRIYNSTLRLQKSGGIDFKVDQGTLECRGATFDVDSGDISTLTTDSPSSPTGDAAVLDCTGSTFSKVGLVIEADGVVAAFDNNVFTGGVSSRHIFWKCTDGRSTTTFSGIQFDHSFTGGTAFNVEAVSGASVRVLTMRAAGGVRAGESFDDSTYDSRILWGLQPVIDVKATSGATRVKVEWKQDDQTDEGTFGYNVYQSRLLDGGKWTSAPSYNPGNGKTTFTDSNANFSSFVSIGDTFHPKFSSTTVLTVLGLTATTLLISGDAHLEAASGDAYSFFVRRNGSLLSGAITSHVADSLTNGTTYYFYVTIDDSTQDAPSVRIRSAQVSATPLAASIELLAPGSASATGIVPMTIVGKGTHYVNGTTTVSVTFGSNLTVNDNLVISPTLILSDLTLNGATVGTWTVQTTTNSVWGVGGYNETPSLAGFSVSANPASLTTRPTLVFSTNNSGISENANTSGSFVLNIDFTNQGAGINQSSLQLFASRNFDAKIGWDLATTITAGTEIRGAGVVIETLNGSRATWTIEQATWFNGYELFADCEYTVTARVADNSGNYSEWASRRFYVNGASSSVIKVPDVSSVPVKLKQGDMQRTISVTGSGLSASPLPSFGSNITVHSATATGGGSGLDIVLSVDQLAVCGPRTFTTNSGSKTGVVIVEYPTNILPTTTNAEPSRNPAVGGLDVLLVNGAFFKGETDLAVRGRMMGISWSRFCRTDINYNGPLGNTWVGFYYQRAIYDSASGDIHWYTSQGRKEVITDVTGGFSSPAGVYVKAERETTFNTITLTDAHGSACVFNSQGRLWRCRDRNGNTVECIYNYAGQLTQIRNDLAETFDVSYATHGRVYQVTDNMWNDGTTPSGLTQHNVARVIEYTYDSNGDLRELKAPTTPQYDGTPYARITFGYRYDAAHRLMECINPREFAGSSSPVSFLENVYENGKVVAQRLGGQDQWLYVRYESSTLVRVVDRRGLRTDFTLDGSGRATAVKRYTAFFSVDTDDPITHSTVNQTVGKVRASDPTSFDTTITYDSNNEISSVTSPRGNMATITRPAKQTNGTATSAPSATVLTDSGKSWTTNAFAGMVLRMGTAAANFKYYPIVSNTSTTITINGAYSLSGDGWVSGSAYAVYTVSGDPLAEGNVLSVKLTDEGLGAEADIVMSCTYESKYQLIKTLTNPRSKVTTFTYDYEETASSSDSAAGNLVQVETDTITGSMAASGKVKTRMTYNEFGQIVTQVDGVGNTTLFKYYTSGSNKGFLQQTIRSYGDLNITSELAYDPVGNVNGSWPPQAFYPGVTKDDYKTICDTNELNQTWMISSPKLQQSGGLDDRATTYRYFDANGNLTSVWREYVTASGSEPTAPTTPINGPTGFPSKASTAMAATWVESNVVYNLLNLPTERITDAIAGSSVTRLTSRVYYDANDNVVRSVSPLGNASAWVYDERELVFQSIAGEYSDSRAFSEADYDTNGNLVKSRDPKGNESTYTYDGFDRLTISKDPAGNECKSIYDANSNVTSSICYSGNVAGGVVLAQTDNTFDEIDRMYISKHLAKDHFGNALGDGWDTTTTQLDAKSRMTQTTDDNGIVAKFFYDGADRLVRTRDAIGNENEFTYNLDGYVLIQKYRELNGLTGASEVSHDEKIYDVMNREKESRDRRYSSTFNTAVKHTYDGWSRVTKYTDASAVDTSYEYDLLSRSTKTTRTPTVTSSDNVVTTTTYDDDSRVIKRSVLKNDGSNWQDTTYVWGERNQLLVQRNADGDARTFTYDLNLNLTGWSDPQGTSVITTFDNRNLPMYRNITRGTNIKGANYESYDYDALGRLTSCSNYDTTKLICANSWTYNTLGKAETKTQTICDPDGNTLGTWTTGAEYDASGRNIATSYSDGRTVSHTYDGLGRLSNSFDFKDFVNIADYTYTNTRLIQRTFGNNTRTNYKYTPSGCGCGGFAGFCERVEHVRGGDGEIMAASEQRFDVNGNVMAQKRDDMGGLGMVFRHDKIYRHNKTYYGVDLSGSAVDTAVGTPPSVFGMLRTYNMDTRGSRTGSSGVADTNQAGGTVRNTSYTVDGVSGTSDNMNLYTTVDGGNFAFDNLEQMTYDPGTGLYQFYDYQGHLIAQDKDSNGSTPEKIYTYDAQGHRKTEQGLYDDSDSVDAGLRRVNPANPGRKIWKVGPNAEDKTVHYLPKKPVASAPQLGTMSVGQGQVKPELGTMVASGSNVGYTNVTVDSPNGGSCTLPDDFALESHTFAANGTLRDSVYYFQGLSATVSGSSSDTSWLVADPGPHGGTPFNSIVAEKVVINGGGTLWRFRGENYHGDAILFTNINGEQIEHLHYTEWGVPLRMTIAYDGADAEFVAASGGGVTHAVDTVITMNTGVSVPSDLAGKEIVISKDGLYVCAEVISSSSGARTITVYDPASTVYEALNGQFQGFVVYNFDKYTTGGTWSSVSYEEGPGETTLTMSSFNAASFVVGWSIIPDVTKPVPLMISGWDSTSGIKIKVKGDITGWVTSGDRFRILAPCCVSASTGALETDELKAGSRVLYAGYRYQTPMSGIRVSTTTYGRQTGANFAGTWHTLNRVYDPVLGRFTTTDPLLDSFNLVSYCESAPLGRADVSGLKPTGKNQEDWGKVFTKRTGGTSTKSTENDLRRKRVVDTVKVGDKCYKIWKHMHWWDEVENWNGTFQLWQKYRESEFDQDAYDRAVWTWWGDLVVLVGDAIIQNILAILGIPVLAVTGATIGAAIGGVGGPAGAASGAAIGEAVGAIVGGLIATATAIFTIYKVIKHLASFPDKDDYWKWGKEKEVRVGNEESHGVGKTVTSRQEGYYSVSEVECECRWYGFEHEWKIEDYMKNMYRDGWDKPNSDRWDNRPDSQWEYGSKEWVAE